MYITKPKHSTTLSKIGKRKKYRQISDKYSVNSPRIYHILIVSLQDIFTK